MTRELVVVSSSDLSEQPDNLFIIEEHINKITSNRYKNYWKLFAQLDIKTTATVPIYDILWPHIVRSGEQSGALIELVLLGEELSKCIDKRNIDTIRCEEIDRRHKAVVVDIATSKDISIKNEITSVRNRLLVVFITIFNGLPFLIDQIIGMISSIFYRENTSDVAFLPFPGRFCSMLPVLESAEYQYDIILSRLWMSFIRNIRDLPEVFKEYSGRPITSFTTPRVFYREILFCISLGKNIKSSGEPYDQIVAHIESWSGLNMKKSVEFSINEAFTSNLRALLTGILSKEFYNYKQIVVGGMHPRDRAILYQSNGMNIGTFYIPHSITKRYEIVPPTKTTMFVPGKFGLEYLQSLYNPRYLPKLLPLGRPYLTNIANCNEDLANRSKDSINESISLLIITQPFQDEVRLQFVQDILKSAGKCSQGIEIDIKVHPAESASYYSDFLKELDGSGVIKIHDDNLLNLLQNSDLILTMASNVGMEAMLNGTACVVYNTKSPLIEIPAYATPDFVPVFREQESLAQFLTKLNPDKILEIKNKQNEYFCDNVATSREISKNIAEEIYNR